MVIAVLLFAFLSAIWLEVRYSKKYALNAYDFQSSVSHVSIVLGQQVINLFAMGWIAALYVAIAAQFHLFDVSMKSAIAWILVMLGADLTYYIAHRASHRINFFLGIHSVHHQAKDYNFASALRLPWLNRVVLFVFYLPFAFIGVPVQMIGATFLVNLVFGSLAHNGVFRKNLGWIEDVFVTPRNHRVHHGIEGKYLDKNFGGVFIFWDKLFGSYQALDDQVPVRMPGAESPDFHDPLKANFDYYQKLFWGMRKGSLSLIFKSPEALEVVMREKGYLKPVDAPYEKGKAHWGPSVTVLGLLVFLFVGLAYSIQHASPLWIQLGLAAALFLGSLLPSRLARGV